MINIKKVLRFIYYKNERKRIKREKAIRNHQNLNFSKHINKNSKKLIVFLVDGADWHTGLDKISGGIMSIASIYQETKKLKTLHDSEVIMLTLPQSYLLRKHTQFPNDIDVYRFDQLKAFQSLDKVILHVPEFKFKKTFVNYVRESLPYLESNNIHFNILNQRLDLMPDPFIIKDISNLGFYITQTTAHEQYTTNKIYAKFGIPLHKLSVYAKPSRYNFKSFVEKENLILISPDADENKSEILNVLASNFPEYTIEIIKDITYLEYLDRIERAKFMVTFGEGLDFYFIETVFTGGISFAVYNTVFFTEIFKNIAGVFNDYEHMKNEIVNEIRKYENKSTFAEINALQFKAVNSIYNDNDYEENIKNFYLGNYTFK